MFHEKFVVKTDLFTLFNLFGKQLVFHAPYFTNSFIIFARLMILYHVLVHQDDTGALHATLWALARAGRRLVPVLLLCVSAEVGRLREAEPAERALKRFLPGVHHHMV